MKRDKPIWLLPDERRTVEVEWFEGSRVVISYSALRKLDGLRTVQGDLLGVATPLTGGSTWMAILRRVPDGRIIAVSLATVYDVQAVKP